MNWFRRLSYHPVFIRLLHWEYWSFSTIYGPIYIIFIGLCVRARSFFFFAAANPRIKNGGFLNESKKEITPMIPPMWRPNTVFFSVPANPDLVLQELYNAGMQFPMIGKPDIGGRGRGVQTLPDESAVRNYVTRTDINFHIQEFVPYKNEVGIFYYRLPNKERGCLSGIVRKEFLSVKGDGRSTIAELLQYNKRAILQRKTLDQVYGSKMHNILKADEVRVLVPYGNHARGAKFIDDSHLIDALLEQSIDAVCREIPDFYFGRLDIRYDNWEDLRNGKNFSIIEVNGAGSEPTHIYDPRHNLFFAWKEIIRHWVLLWKISRLNHKKGFPYLTLQEGISMFREDKRWSAELEKLSEALEE